MDDGRVRSATNHALHGNNNSASKNHQNKLLILESWSPVKHL